MDKPMIYYLGSFYSRGGNLKIRSTFEGKTVRGILWDSDDKGLVAIKLPDGKIHWTHESHTSFDY